MKNKYVYIAAPYAKPDPVNNTNKVIWVADGLVRLGFAPYVPHLTLFWHLLIPHEPDYWYRFDLEWLDKCDCLLRLDGESYGADEEVKYAISKGKTVYYSIPELVDASH